MRIDNEIKLDFKDVLIRPKRSTLKSRAQVDLGMAMAVTAYVRPMVFICVVTVMC